MVTMETEYLQSNCAAMLKQERCTWEDTQNCKNVETNKHSIVGKKKLTSTEFSPSELPSVRTKQGPVIIGDTCKSEKGQIPLTEFSPSELTSVRTKQGPVIIGDTCKSEEGQIPQTEFSPSECSSGLKKLLLGENSHKYTDQNLYEKIKEDPYDHVEYLPSEWGSIIKEEQMTLENSNHYQQVNKDSVLKKEQIGLTEYLPSECISTLKQEPIESDVFIGDKRESTENNDFGTIDDSALDFKPVKNPKSKGYSFLCGSCEQEFGGAHEFISHPCSHKTLSIVAHNSPSVTDKSVTDTHVKPAEVPINGNSKAQPKPYTTVQINLYVCEKCGESYNAKRDLNTHMINHTSRTSPFVCEYCRQKFDHYANLKLHLKDCGIKNPPPSTTNRSNNICNKNDYSEIFHVTADLLNHLITTKKYLCEQCSQEFDQFSDYKQHMTSHSESNMLKRKKCGQKLYSNQIQTETLQKNTDHKEKGSSRPCPVGLVDSTVFEQSFTTKTSQKDKVYKGNVIFKPCSMKSTEKKPLFPCVYCGVHFFNDHDLELHLKWHPQYNAFNVDQNSQIPYDCKVCGSCFNSQKSLQKHVIQSAKNPFQCKICMKRFSKLHYLNMNLRRSSNHGYNCKLGNLNLDTKRDFKVHKMRFHRYECKECGALFMKKAKLKWHLWKHAGRKIYHCVVCRCRYVNKMCLKRHMEKHKRSHKCKICRKTFFTEGHLTKHKIVHSSIGTPYQCAYCNKKYKFIKSVKDHMFKKHQNQELPKSEIQSFKCEHCETVVWSDCAEDFTNHLKNHVHERRYELKITKLNISDYRFA